MNAKHQGLLPAFDLSRASYFLDFVLVPVAVAALMVIEPINIWLIVLGIVAWSVAEYWIHRAIFHGHTLFEPMHQMHHALPKDMIGVASWGTFAGFGAIWVLFGASFCAGFMLGYLFYCAIHVRMHHGNRNRFGRYIRLMFEHHARHHRGGQGNYGVSSPVWDLVFRTYRRSP